MATFSDPKNCFDPIEVVERLLGIREELGFSRNVYLVKTQELTDFLDAFGFDIYALSAESGPIDYDGLSTPVVPGGDTHHSSFTGH